MRRETTIQITAFVCMVACLGASALLAVQISASVGRHRLVYSEKAEKGDPPIVAAGIAMGAFRGLFVNWLWIRANDLKEKGKYFEAVDLAKTITRLQPRFPKVWQFHAWNLAYNISVATQTPQERWNWVQAGIRLLREEGIPANPTSIDLHRELAWIYVHKVQGFMDDAHRFYKIQHAREWSVVMGRPPSDINYAMMQRPGEVKKVFAERWIGPVARAPDTLDELYELAPEGRELVEKLRAAGIKLDRSLLERFETLAAFAEAGAAANVGTPIGSDPLGVIMLDDAYARAGRLLINHVRKRVLMDEYHMEPDRMLRYTLKFGPLDWRHPAAHSLYWSSRGVEECLLQINQQNKKDHDFINTDRITIQSVQELFRTGLLFYDLSNPEFYLALPNTEFIDSYHEALVDLESRSDFDKGRTYRFYWAGYENFMRDAIRFLYRRGDKETAAVYQQRLYTHPKLNTNNYNLFTELAKPLEQFVQDEIVRDNRETSPTVALQEISAALGNAFFLGLLRNDEKAFRGEMGYAQLFHAKYQETQAFNTWVTGPSGRMGFPPFNIFAGRIFAQMIEFAGIPQGPTMFRRAPPELAARAWVILDSTPFKARINAMARNGGPDFDVWFPKPEGAERFKSEMIPRDERPDDKGRIEVK